VQGLIVKSRLDIKCLGLFCRFLLGKLSMNSFRVHVGSWSGSRKLVLSETCIRHLSQVQSVKRMAKKAAKKAAAPAPKAMKAKKA
jgi:hypothetical protein